MSKVCLTNYNGLSYQLLNWKPNSARLLAIYRNAGWMFSVKASVANRGSTLAAVEYTVVFLDRKKVAEFHRQDFSL